MVDPGLLHLVQRSPRSEPLDRDDLLAFRGAHRQRARTHRLSVDVHGAGPALGDAAAVLGAGQADILPDRPQKWRVRVYINVMGLSVDGQACHVVLLSALTRIGCDCWVVVTA